MEDYKPNSHRSKEENGSVVEKKEIKKVTTGKVITRKNNVRKFTDVFVSEDVKNVKDYVFMDVLVPAIKKAISDIVTNGIDMILYGETGRTKKLTGASYISYNKYSDRRDSYDRFAGATRARSGYSYDDIILEDRNEAAEVLDRMDELLDTYQVVSVADLYDLVGMPCDYTANNYGWTNLRNAEVVRIRDGNYMLKLPKALSIK